MDIKQLSHTGAELDQAVTDWLNTLTPVYTLPAQVKLSAVCNPTVPSVNLSWVWGDTEFASGIMIRRKLGAIPQHVGDGELVCNIENCDTVSFEDTDYSASDKTSVGTYDAPVIWYYRAFPYNINGQYQTHYQTSAEYGLKEVSVYSLAEGSMLSTLALEDTFIFGKYGTADLVWRVSSILEDRIMATLHYDQLFTAQFDAPEPNNTNSNRKSDGSNRYATSNVRQFLNATGAAGQWFQAQTDTDVLGSAYTSKDGFLNAFTEAERNLIIPETLLCQMPDEDGGGTETITDLVWLPSYNQMYGSGSEGNIFDFLAGENNTNAKRIENWAVWQWLRSFNPGTAHQAHSVGNSGNAYASRASISNSLRAGLSLPLSSFLTFDEDKAMFRVYAV